jgi:drug/metabolite transporter (DMT)-like permease
MKAWIAFALVSLLWGLYFFGIALGIESFNPFGLVAARYLGGGVIALALAAATGEERIPRRDLPHLMLQGFLLLTAAGTLVSWAEHRVSSGAAAVLCSTTPLYYAVMGRERLGVRTWIGLLVGLGGVALLLLSRSGSQHLALPGVAAIFLAVFLWAYGTLHGRRHVRSQGLFGQPGVQMITGGALALGLVPWTGGFLHGPLTWRAGLGLVMLVLLVDLVGYSAFIYLSRAWPPTRMSTYVYINPLVSVLLGCWVLGERFTWLMGLGMVVIFLGVALLQFRRAGPEAGAGALAAGD